MTITLPRLYQTASTHVFDDQTLVFNRRTGIFYLTDGAHLAGHYTYQNPIVTQNVHLPLRLTAARITAGYTQSELAHLIHVTSLTISLWETGKRNPSIRRRDTIKRILGIDIKETER